jgi:membrane associated rhomboid family serine protease
MFRLTPVVKNLLIINVVVFVLQLLLEQFNITELLSMHQLGSGNFRPYQIFTYMFAHGSIGHIFFNMLGLAFLGPLLEQFWGPKRFLIFYLVTGIGAGALFAGIEYFRFNQVQNDANVYFSDPSSDAFAVFINENRGKYPQAAQDDLIQFVDYYGENENNPQVIERSKEFVRIALNNAQRGIMLGASGAVYGILMAFGLLFPNTKLMLLFPPIPVKAKWLVLALGAYAIYSGFNRNPDDPVAHFAHLGGMLFAFIMIQIWKRDRNQLY